jgi:hypothetical protein
MDTDLLVCSECGHTAKIRYRMPNNWVQCCNKLCGKTTHYFFDGEEQQRDPAAIAQAVEEWNYINNPDHPMTWMEYEAIAGMEIESEEE